MRDLWRGFSGPKIAGFTHEKSTYWMCSQLQLLTFWMWQKLLHSSGHCQTFCQPYSHQVSQFLDFYVKVFSIWLCPQKKLNQITGFTLKISFYERIFSNFVAFSQYLDFMLEHLKLAWGQNGNTLSKRGFRKLKPNLLRRPLPLHWTVL